MGNLVEELIDEGRKVLTKADIRKPRLNAELLLAHVLDCDRMELLLRTDETVSSEEVSQFREALRRRAEQEPIEYITGRAEFYSRDFLVEEGGLIPRPETESLVDIVLEQISSRDIQPPYCICDLGTGTGVIIVTLCLELEDVDGVAVESSAEAMEIARRNAGIHEVDDCIRWDPHDMLASDFEAYLLEQYGQFDVVVSNPPYIEPHERENLSEQVRQYEPDQALFVPEDRNTMYRRLMELAAGILQPEGILAMECSEYDTEAVLDLAETAGYASCTLEEDFRDVPRLFVGLLR